MVQAAVPDGSLEACQAFTASFDNTCTTDAGITEELDSLETHQGAEVSCTGLMICPGTGSQFEYTEDSKCTFTRKLCVSCSTDANTNKVKIKV